MLKIMQIVAAVLNEEEVEVKQIGNELVVV